MRKDIGQLNCLIREGEIDRCAVFLHGFGADASDLYPLADVLDPQHEWTFIFPEAPHEVPVGPSWTGRGWFPISLRELESGVDFTQVRPPGLNQSTEAVKDLLFHLNCPKIVLGGFSQGAMIATDVAMFDPDAIAGLVLYSGVLLDEKGWSKRAKGLSGKPILQSHGMHDPVLAFAAGQRLHDLLKANGAQASLIGFQGQHEIPMPALNKTREFLAALK